MFDDEGEGFKLVRFLSNLIQQKKLRISDFEGLNFSTVKRKNPAFIKQGQNDKCACGSGNKFKKCCANSEYIDGDHVDIVARKYCIEHSIV